MKKMNLNVASFSERILKLVPRKIVSVILLLTLVFFGNCTSDARNIYVVSVGINNYKYANGLRNAENDAKDFANLFRSKTRFVSVITGHYATKQNILNTLREVAASCRNDDVFIFFFSGHGVKEGLCQYDATSKQNVVSFSDIQKILVRCRASNKQMYLDACYSGSIRTAGDMGAYAPQNFFNDSQGVMLFMSSRNGQVSREQPGAQNGVFTKYLLLGMRGRADSDKNRVVTARELFLYVSRNVSRETGGRQNPVMWGKFNNSMVIY